MPKLFKLFFANYYLHTAENFYTLFYLNALYANFFYGENTVAKDNKANDQNKRLISNKMR